MKPKTWKILDQEILQGCLLLALVCAVIAPSQLAKETSQAASTPAQAGTQKTFATAKEAAEALIKAAEDFDVPALKEVLGPDGNDLISSEDPVQDKNRAAAFA